MIIKVTQGQTIFDLAIKHYGCYEGVFVLMEDNNLSLTTELIAGQSLIIQDVIPELNDKNVAVALNYKINQLSVNSQYKSDTGEGIYVEDDYVEGDYVE